MDGALDLGSMVEAARKAAAAGDFSTAARLLRDVSVIQEATLGSLHPELAKTLNVLALVCERANYVAEAEQCHRRAHAIAVASLGPRDPFVTNSIKNLVDFCAAHNIPIWTPREGPSDDDRDRTGEDLAADAEVTLPADAEVTLPADAEVAPPADTADTEVTLPALVQAVEANGATDVEADAAADAEIDTAPVFHRETAPIISQSAHRTIVPLAIGIAAIVAVGFMVRPRETVSTTTSTPPPPTTTSAPALETKPTAAVEATPNTKAARVERPASRATSVTSPPVTVLKAQLCSALDRTGSPDWRCTPASSRLRQGSGETGLPPGTYIFYTRLMTTKSMTVQHRWYFNGQVHQVMRLRVAPNPRGGYRTFSSNRIIRERAGDWRVELRAADGALLQEERFVVR
ncbi:MAG TPA: DUF2914 domain-containing protein [Vicinamibacterales bacterium]|nr:DUF2914 domain-containing protein [Vicinamibacterales bacterium]